MGDNDKPFGCTEPGCGMRFTNEDHLSVHRMKHEMSLTLTSGGKAASFLSFADQTPTPTKFLKNCEEIGLFNELIKNPFEEAFKKAAESLSEAKVQELHEHLALVGPSAESEALNTPTPHLGLALQLQLAHAASLETPAVLKEDFIPLPGPGGDTGSTVATTSSPSSSSNLPPLPSPLAGKAGSSECSSAPGSTATTPTQHNHSSSTSGLPFKLKLKREPLGDTEISQIAANSSQEVVRSSPALQAATPAPVSALSSPVAITPARVSIASLAVSTAARGVTSVAAPVDLATRPSPAGSAASSQSMLAIPSAAAAGKASSHFVLQVMVQMPSGEMVPIQVPASLANTLTAAATTVATAATPTAQMISGGTSGLISSALAGKGGVIPMVSVNTITSLGASAAVSSTTGAASFLTKQKLKAALQQNLGSPSEGVERMLVGSPSPPGPSFQSMHTIVSRSAPASPAASLASSSSSLHHLPMAATVAVTQVAKVLQMPLAMPAPSVDMSPSPPMSYCSDSMYDVELQDADTSTPKRLRKSPDDDPDDRRKKFLERNRAAAARCRQKKKTWITNLEGKADELQSLNAKLQNEVSTLRSEVAQLKALLLAHKDCPITLQLQNSGMLNFKTVSGKGGRSEVILLSENTPSSSELLNATSSKCSVAGAVVLGSTSQLPIVMNTTPASVELLAASTLTTMATGSAIVTQHVPTVTSILVPNLPTDIKNEPPE